MLKIFGRVLSLAAINFDFLLMDVALYLYALEGPGQIGFNKSILFPWTHRRSARVFLLNNMRLK